MRFLLFLAVFHAGCVAPSMVIYGRGTAVTRTGPKTVAVPEAKIYGDLVGNTVVQGSIVTVTASGGYYNSTVTRENYKGIAAIGRTWLQPIIWGAVSGGVVGGAINQAGSQAGSVFSP